MEKNRDNIVLAQCLSCGIFAHHQIHSFGVKSHARSSNRMWDPAIETISLIGDETDSENDESNPAPGEAREERFTSNEKSSPRYIHPLVGMKKREAAPDSGDFKL